MAIVNKPKMSRPKIGVPKAGVPKVGAPKPVNANPAQPEEPVVVEEPIVVPEKPMAVEQEQVVEVPIEEPIVKEPKEEVIVEEEKEEPKQKAKKKSTRKSNKKQDDNKEVVVEAEQDNKEVLPNMSLKDAMIAMSDEINIEEEGWAEIKQEIVDKLKTTVIDPDISPTDMRYLAAEIDSILTDLKIYKVDVENRYKALTERMEYIRVQNAVGTNSESRKASGYAALYNHKKDPDATESINLIQIKLVLEGQLNFYNSAIETLMSRKSLLVTFLGVVKLEASI
jgi:ribosomal protein S15P/S13E